MICPLSILSHLFIVVVVVDVVVVDVVVAVVVVVVVVVVAVGSFFISLIFVSTSLSFFYQVSHLRGLTAAVAAARL